MNPVRAEEGSGVDEVVVIVLKIDREERARTGSSTPRSTSSSLGATDDSAEFVIYLRFQGIADANPTRWRKTSSPSPTVINEVPKPVVDQNAPLQMLVTNLDYDEFKGRIALAASTRAPSRRRSRSRLAFR